MFSSSHTLPLFYFRLILFNSNLISSHLIYSILISSQLIYSILISSLLSSSTLLISYLNPFHTLPILYSYLFPPSTSPFSSSHLDPNSLITNDNFNFHLGWQDTLILLVYNHLDLVASLWSPMNPLGTFLFMHPSQITIIPYEFPIHNPLQIAYQGSLKKPLTLFHSWKPFWIFPDHT